MTLQEFEAKMRAVHEFQDELLSKYGIETVVCAKQGNFGTTAACCDDTYPIEMMLVSLNELAAKQGATMKVKFE